VSGFHEVFPARMEALARVLTLAEAAGAAAGFDRRDTLRLTLVLEELFTNTVAHGHGGDSDAPVGVALDAERGRVALTYEDTGPHFDLVAAAAARADEPPAEARAPGGLGLVLIARLVTDLQYTRAGDRNRISLSVRASPP
jgi:anti-sigma regulatory factor (Ser/Thr protein kinase)